MLPEVRLRAIEKNDLRKMRDWRNDVIENMREFRLINMPHQQRWWEGYCEQAFQRYPQHLMYVCEAQIGNSWTAIGVGGWTYIDWLNRRAELSIYIGNRELRGCGYGRAFLRALHAIAFEELGLQAVWLEVHDWNEAARKLYETEGYTYIGVWRDARQRGGVWYPTHIYDYTKADYFTGKELRKKRGAQVERYEPQCSITTGGDDGDGRSAE